MQPRPPGIEVEKHSPKNSEPHEKQMRQQDSIRANT
jgi:hypothetical protein